MTTEEAKEKLERAYRVQFDCDPDEMGATIIDLASDRVAGGLFFTWGEVNGVRKVQFHKEDQSGQIVTTNGIESEEIEIEAEHEIAVRRLPEHTELIKMVNKKQADFCRLVASGLPQGRAWELAGYNPKNRNNANICASKALRIPHVAAYLRSLREAVGAKDVLSLWEKRKGLADIWRTPVGEIDENHPLAQEVKRKTTTSKDGTVFEEVTVKMPGKIDALKLDAQLAGELKEQNQSANVISLQILNERIRIVGNEVVPDTGVLEIEES